MQFFYLARIRAHQSVFVFLLHPSPLSHIILFHNGLGVKEKPIFSFTSSFTLEMRGSPLLQKNRIFSFFLRRKVEKCRGFRPKVFTQKQLIHNHLRKIGEEVKAKTKSRCVRIMRARGPRIFTRSTERPTSSAPSHFHLFAARTRHRESRPPLARSARPRRAYFSTKITG